MNAQQMVAKMQEMEAQRVEELRRRENDRVRIIITMVNEPELNDPAAYFYLQVKSTARIRDAMILYQSRVSFYARDGFAEASPNSLPQYGPQLIIDELALNEITGYWGADDWRDGICPKCICWALDDFFFALTGYHALVEFAD